MASAYESTYEAFARTDAEWSAEIERAFPGEHPGDVRFTVRGQGQPGSALREKYEAWAAARDAWQEERGIPGAIVHRHLGISSGRGVTDCSTVPAAVAGRDVSGTHVSSASAMMIILRGRISAYQAAGRPLHAAACQRLMYLLGRDGLGLLFDEIVEAITESRNAGPAVAATCHAEFLGLDVEDRSGECA